MAELTPDGLPILKGSNKFTADGLPILKKKVQSVDSVTGGVGSVPGLEPFQQFKPGVNKYVRQPAPVAPAIRNQGPAPKTVAQAQKEKPVAFSPEAFRQEAVKNPTSGAANLMTGLTNTASGFYRIPELIYSTFAAPQNLAADILDKPELRANYDYVSKGTYNPLGVIDKTADYLQQSSKEWSEKKRKYDDNITTQLSKGDFGGAARQIGDQIEESIPGMLSMYVTGPLATAGKFAPTARTLTMAAPFAGSQLNEIKDNPNIPDYLKPINAWLNGTAEVVLEEQFGTKALVDDAIRIARTEGREAAVNTIKNVLRPLGERFIKKVQPVTNVLGNGLEEGITTFSQNVVDKYTGVDPNRGLLDNVPDSIIVGTAQGTGVTALGKGMDVLTNPKTQAKIDALSKQRDDLMNDLDSPSIPDNIKGDLVDKLTDINEEINIVLDENRAEYDALSDDDIGTLKTLNDQIDDKVDLLNNTSLSETSRQLAQNDLTTLQKELATKQKEVSSKVKQFKTQANAVQEPSTTGQVPPVIEGGQNLQEGGEGVGQRVEGTQAPQEAPIQEPTAEIIPEEKVTKRGVEIELPSELKVTEVKPYTEVEQNYYRPDQQLKFNQGTYEPVRIIANPDVIKAISIGSKLSDFSGKGKGKNVSEQDMLFAQDIAKKLGYVSGDGTGSSILLNKAVKELAKQNRNKNQEVFITLGKEKTPIDIKAPQAKIISPENSSNYANLTEDDKGNFVFYHFSNQKLNEVNPSKYGSNPERVTSPEEATAMGKVGGMSNFYPNLNFRERQVSGKYGYEVKIPKEKVYDFNTDVNNYIKEAKARFKKENPNAAFTPNDQLAYITKIAEENGYDMVVAEWADGRTRANSTKNLKVTDFSESDGNKVKKAFKNQYQSNLDKGFETVRPESKDKVLQSVYDDIYKERNSQERYDDLYRLYSESNKYTQDEITELINNSDISDKLKAKYNDAVNYKEPSKSSKLKIKEVVQPKSEEQAAIHRETGGSTFTVDGTNRNGTKAGSVSIFPERTKIVEGGLTKDDIDTYVKENSDIYSGNEDVLAVGTWLDGKTGENYLDVSAVLPKKEARRLGKDYNQIAIWDLEKGREIPTGGTGEAIEGLKPELDRVSDIRNILGPQKALKQAEVKVEETQDLASKIRTLKINIGKGTAQSNIAGLPIALYNSVVETVALFVEAGSTIAEAIDKAVKKYNLDKVESFNKSELTKNIQDSAKPKRANSVKDIDVDKIRTQSRPGNRVSKGLIVKGSGDKKFVQESDDLSIKYVKKNAPVAFIKNANILAEYPIVAGIQKFGEIKTEAQAQKVYDIFIRQVADNLKYLVSEYNPKLRDISTLWYDGANILASNLANKYGVSTEQVSGIIASLSPQKDWYINVRLAELVMIAYKQNPTLTNEMIDKQIAIAKEGVKEDLRKVNKAKKNLEQSKTKENIEASIKAQKKYNDKVEKSEKIIKWLKTYVGTDMNSAPIEVQPYLVRLHNELNNPKDYDILRPDGEIVGVAKNNDGENSKIAWGSYGEIGKAVSIYNNGSQENITRTLGEMHKIRNFYNNIIDPMSKDGDVTIDTHAVAAALLQALSGNTKQVKQNFGVGTSNSSVFGIKGLYYAYLEGYQLAAKELGLLPRQVQSITWEAVRGLFPDVYKLNDENVKEINDIWKNYENGKITIEQTRKAVDGAAGGVKDPDWSKSVLSESEIGTERGPIGGGLGVSGPDTVGGPSTVRVAAKALRKLKIDLGKGTAQSNIAGLPIALYNSAIETIALGLEAGASLTEAINNAIKKHKLSKVKEFDKDLFISEIENATGEKVKKETSIRNAEVEAKRAEYGFPEPAQRPFQSNKTTLDKAKQAIKDGVSVNEVIEKALSREPITDVESAMIALYQGTKEAELLKANSEIEQLQSSSTLDFTDAVEKRNKIIDDLVNAYNAGEVSGNVSARALQARKIKVLQDDSLANMLIQKRKANNNRKLTNKQVEEITQLYTKMKATKAALEAKIEKLNEENAKLKLRNAAPKIVKEVKAESTGKTKEQLKAEREDIFKQMSELARKSRANLSMNPIPAEMIPLVVKLAKNYLATGAKTLDEVIDKVQADLSGYIENVSKNDIRRTLADYDADTRPTKENIQDEVFGERSKEKQIKDIEDLEKQARKEKDPEAAQLLLDEANAKRTAMEKQAEKDGLDKEQSRLDNYKKNIQKRIDELQGKLKKGDYAKTPKNEIKLDDEARKLKKQLEDIKFQFAVELEKDALASRNKVQKFTDGLIEFFNLPRSLMATADFSAPLRQAAVVTVAYPDIAAKAAIEMGVQWASSEKAEQWMDDLMESPGYKLMKDSGLYIANVRSAKLSAKEEDFSTNLAGKIPVAGALVNASERAYVAYLNKMRVDIFNRGVELLQNDGYSFATNPKAYKTLANYVNAATGRGSLGGGALEKAGPALNALMFSPRLLASRVRLLTMLADPRMYKKENRTVRNMYLKDMSSFVGFGLAVLALAAAAGAEVEDDPRSTDFGKIKVGDTRWDIWGGFQQPIRAFVQATTEERKSTTTGKIVKLDGSGYGGETGGDVILRFFRGKLAPVPAFLVNAYTGKDVMGRPFELGPAVLQMSYPLVIQSVIESAKKDGVVFGVLATGIPSLLGVGVQTYGANDFLKQGVDDKSINLLLSKKAIAIEPNELDTKVFDVNTGEDRKMSDEEFKKYYADWADYIKMKLRDNYDEYKDMSVDEFETEFRSIKSEATKLAKEDISGVSNTTKTISYREDDESESYKLTPEELKYRQSLNEQYISRHGNIYNKEFKDAIRNGKSPEEAAIIANKRLTSKANEYSRKIILKQHKRGRGYDF